MRQGWGVCPRSNCHRLLLWPDLGCDGPASVSSSGNMLVCLHLRWDKSTSGNSFAGWCQHTCALPVFLSSTVLTDPQACSIRFPFPVVQLLHENWMAGLPSSVPYGVSTRDPFGWNALHSYLYLLKFSLPIKANLHTERLVFLDHPSFILPLSSQRHLSAYLSCHLILATLYSHHTLALLWWILTLWQPGLCLFNLDNFITGSAQYGENKYICWIVHSENDSI